MRELVRLVDLAERLVLERHLAGVDLIGDLDDRVFDYAELLLLRETEPGALLILVIAVHLTLQFQPPLVAFTHRGEALQLIHDPVHLFLDRLFEIPVLMLAADRAHCHRQLLHLVFERGRVGDFVF